MGLVFIIALRQVVDTHRRSIADMITAVMIASSVSAAVVWISANHSPKYCLFTQVRKSKE